MTKVSSVYLDKLTRQATELSRRVQQGTLDAEEITDALQLLIENRFLLYDRGPKEVSHTVILENLEPLEGTEVSIYPYCREGERAFDLKISIGRATHPFNSCELEFDTPRIGYDDIPTFLAPIGAVAKDAREMFQLALEKTGKLTLEFVERTGRIQYTFQLGTQLFYGVCSPTYVQGFLRPAVGMTMSLND
jgi:hypothetical protein